MGRNYGTKTQNFIITTTRDGQRKPRFQYNEHDDRGEGHWRGGGNKRVSFKDRRGGIQKRDGRGRGGSRFAFSNVVLDDDQDMDGQAGRSRPNSVYFSTWHLENIFDWMRYTGIVNHPVRGQRGGKYGRGRGRGGAYVISRNLVNDRRIDRRGGQQPLQTWHKVIVTMGSKYDKVALLGAMKQFLNNHAGFMPVGYMKQGPNTIFFIEDNEVGTALKRIDESNPLMVDGFKVQLRVESHPHGPPKAQLTEELKQKMMTAMSSRYNVQNKALDLKNFHNDPAFLGEQAFLPLFRGNVFDEAIRIIGDHIPEVEAIDLSQNKLYDMGKLALLANKARNVKILYLHNNKFRDIKDVDRLAQFPLVEIRLDGNPLTSAYGGDKTEYISHVRKVFKNLVLLDGSELPKQITFDADDNSSRALPPIQKMMTCNMQANGIVTEFLKEYFKVYDSDSRDQLLNAYHKEAIMSLNVSYPHNASAHGVNRLTEYQTESRNLLHHAVQHPVRRQKLLHIGNLAIAGFLDKLPRTEHDLSSFTLDIPFFVESLMTFTVSGTFRERGVESKPLRHFNRMFVVVPQGSGFCIINETLYITLPTNKQRAEAFKSPPEVSSPQAPQVPVQVLQDMVAQVAQRTGMNLKWSELCLNEVRSSNPNATLEDALKAFEAARREGKIPPDAFQN